MEVGTIGKSEKDNVTSLQQKSVESRIRKEVKQKGPEIEMAINNYPRYNFYLAWSPPIQTDMRVVVLQCGWLSLVHAGQIILATAVW